MKKILTIALGLVMLNGYAQSKKELAEEVTNLKAKIAELEKKKEINMEDTQQKFSYALGVNIGQNLKQQGIDELNTEALAEGLADILSGSPKLSDQEIGTVIQTEMQKAQQAKHAENIEAGKSFLEENAKRAEVQVTASGLQYEVVSEGSGPKPTPSDKVKVHYHGTLIDGTVFDSSVQRGQPAEFGVTQVIQGWVEGLQLMPQGSKFKFYIPYNLAYGERGAGGSIGPYSTLVFEVELLEIVK